MDNSIIVNDVSSVHAVIYSDAGEPIEIKYITSCNLESEWSEAGDRFALNLEYDNFLSLQPYIIVGGLIEIFIDDKCVFIGFVEKVNPSNSADSGKSVKLSGRDFLGVLQKKNFPYGFALKPDYTLKKAMEEIFFPFGINSVQIDDSVNLSKATLSKGGFIGIKQKGKTPKSRQTSFKRNLNRELQPKANEKVLEFARKVANLYGMNLKLIPGTKDLLVSSPTYNRKNSPILYKLTTSNGEPTENIISLSHDFSISDLPTIIIGKANAQSGGSRTIFKTVYVSELLGYAADSTDYVDGVTVNLDKYNVEKKAKFIIIEPNLDYLENLPEQIRKGVSKTMPITVNFFDSEKATSLDELIFETSKQMYDLQNKAVTFNYVVRNFSDPTSGAIYNVNNLINVFSNSSGNTTKDTFWINKRRFEKTINGTRTYLELKPAYVYDFFHEE
jgi:hypothetical protein